MLNLPPSPTGGPRIIEKMRKIDFLILFGCFLFAQGSLSPVWAGKAQFAEIEEVRQDIALLNLLRGLYLSSEQLVKIHDLAGKAENIREGIRKEGESRKGEFLKSFSDLRDALYLAPGNEKRAQETAKDTDHQIKERVGKGADQIAALEEEAGKILTSAQAAIIEDFRPCLIPPQSLNNPVRVGQAAAAGGPLIKATDLIHAAPAELWKSRGQGLLGKLVGHLEEESGQMSQPMKDDIRRRLLQTAEKIRACTDVDFALQRETLASELLLIDHKKGLKKGHRKLGDLAKWLLSDAFVRVYPRWLENLKNQQRPEEHDEDSEGFGVQNVAEKLDRVLNNLRRMYNQRKNERGLPAYEELARPITQAAQKLDEKQMLKATLHSMDALNAVRMDRDSVRALSILARFSAKRTGLPLLNPQHDPFGLAADLKTAQDSSDPASAGKSLRALIDLIQQFK